MIRRCSSRIHGPNAAVLCGSSSRCVVQANSAPQPSIFDQYENHRLAGILVKNYRGNYYRLNQKVFPNVETLEVAMTEFQHDSVERTPPQLLPQRQRDPRMTVEGKTSRQALLDYAEPEGAMIPPEPMSQSSESLFEDLESGEILQQQAQATSLPTNDITSKILTEEDVAGSVLSSAMPRRELGTSEEMEARLYQSMTTNSAAEGKGVAWSAIRGLDPVMQQMARSYFGPTATLVQRHLLTSLLNEDHNDVIMNGVTGSGKTTALMLALLQGIRSEDAGFNVFVASDAVSAKRMFDAIRSFCGRRGGTVVDRDQEDMSSWVSLCPFRANVAYYASELRASLRKQETPFQKSGPCRLLITTSDVMCELLFEHKFQFEKFGYLRRVYCDEVGKQLQMLDDYAPTELVQARLKDPVALELLLGTLHQLPGAHIRSILQIGCVAADVDTRMKDHLKALCVKPEAHTTILSALTVPSTVHCVFSFHTIATDLFTHVVTLIRNSSATIPGRAIIFIRDADDILQVRKRLRSLGMDARMLSEVQEDGKDVVPWKFLLLKESEGWGANFDHLSHVFITFAPKDRNSFLHLAGRVGRMGNVGWAYTICDRRDAKHCSEVASQLNIDFVNSVMRPDLTQESPSSVQRLIQEPSLYGMDPQFAVQQHHEDWAETPDLAPIKREFFSYYPEAAKREFLMEDYTPADVLSRRVANAKKLAFDVEQDPLQAMQLRERGLLKDDFTPTRRLKNMMDLPQEDDVAHQQRRRGGARGGRNSGRGGSRGRGRGR